MIGLEHYRFLLVFNTVNASGIKVLPSDFVAEAIIAVHNSQQLK